MVPVGEGDPGVGGAARRRGHPRHDLKRDPFVGEGRDLLAAPPEDERVPALEPQHAPALAREADEEAVDVGLPDRVLVPALPRVDLLRVAPHEGEHAGGHEAVVHHHVRLLHEAHGAEGEEVRVAGAGPDEVDLPRRRAPRAVPGFGKSRSFGRSRSFRRPLPTRASWERLCPARSLGRAAGRLAARAAGRRRRERRRERRARLLDPARERHLGDRAFEHPVPERPPVGDPGQAGVDLRPGRARELREPPEGAGDEGLEPRPDVAGEGGGGAAGGDRREHRGAIDDGGHREVAVPGVRSAVREDAARLGEGHDPAVERPVVGGRDDEPPAFEVGGVEPPAPQLHRPLAREVRGGLAHFRGDDAHPPPGRGERLGPARPDRSGPDHQARPAPEVQEDGKLLHRGSVRFPRRRRPRRAAPEGESRRGLAGAGSAALDPRGRGDRRGVQAHRGVSSFSRGQRTTANTHRPA